MNAEPASSVAPDDAAVPVDDRRPWLGLASFTEETRSYFYGREEEVAELARRVQRKLLTVLFGQSGLGKTSILRAGLVPRLRGQGYCPVYVRVDYARETPEPAEQIKQAIARTARRSGEWTQAGVASEGESLWEFLHHRDDLLLDESGSTLIPLLIFDQFEEIFTLAQADEFGRARAARFVADLADLVENRPPRSLEARLEADDSTAERFDFARSDYRVLIALREDYLAPLEGLKSVMPSVTQNRLRLAPMTGTQGLAAVLRPGKNLVSEEVAEAIVRFVAGGSELANAEVEPSLLSLICRELNDTRIEQGRKEISLDLLAGSHASILSNFYERALADQPAEVRRIIEDELLTDSGFRENIAEERLKRSFATAGATPDTLAVLVNRRLLRIEERLDVRRVELTHDVLCGVVKSSRDLRHEREAREATERLLTEQREREIAARRALVRARRIASACIVLAIGAIVAAMFAYWSTQRAQRAERMAQQSRVQAEQLLGYLTDDFARELESSGRLDVVANLAKREVDYFHALPVELKGPSTVRAGAIALLQFAKASRRLGNLDGATAAVSEAERLLEQLRHDGDVSAATTVALARALSTKGRILGNRQDAAAVPTSQRAADLLSPLARDPNASVAVREAEVEILVQLGYQQQGDFALGEKPIITLQRAMKVAAQLGARDLTNIYMTDKYTEAGGWLVTTLITLGRSDEARRAGADAGALADKVLTLRPGDLTALYAQGLIQSALSGLALDELRPNEALTLGLRAEAVQSTLVTLDPSNTISLNNLAADRWNLADVAWSLGRTQESLQHLEAAIVDAQSASKGGPSLLLGLLRGMTELARRQAELGNFAAAEKIGSNIGRYAADLHRSEPKNSALPFFAEYLKGITDATTALYRGDAQAALRICGEFIPRMRALVPRSGLDKLWKNASAYYLNDVKARAEFMLGDYAASEQSSREALEARKHWPVSATIDKSDQAGQSTRIALALVAQKRGAEARQIIEPVVKFRRDYAARNHGDQDMQLGLASALYVQALLDTKRRAALLKEAASLLDAVTVEFKTTHTVREWRDRVRETVRAPAAQL